MASVPTTTNQEMLIDELLTMVNRLEPDQRREALRTVIAISLLEEIESKWDPIQCDWKV